MKFLFCCYSFVGVDKSSYKVNEYILSVGKESEETNSTLLFGRLVRYSFFVRHNKFIQLDV